MIRFVKSAAIPSSLARGAPQTAANCAAFDADPEAYLSGTATFDITNNIYGTKVVKRHLKADQHDKCAFCEAIFDANVAGDVEHYRPKGAVQTDQAKLLPGYYWLGYTWENLSYACPDCNEYRKRDRFPLANEGERARSHNDSIGDEVPLLLDPYGALDPRDHIGFRGEAPIGKTATGTMTIEILGLDRTKLARDRLRHLEVLSLLKVSLDLLMQLPEPNFETLEHIDRLEAKLAAAISPQAPFSAASIDHLEALAIGIDHLPKS